MRSRKDGFTLMEGILGLAVAGILAFVAAPLLNNAATSVSLNGAAHKIESELTFAQSLATTTGDIHGFRALTATTYKVYSRVGAVETPVNSPHTHAPMDNVNLQASFTNVSFAAGAFPAFNIEFDGTGSPIIGGGTNLVLQTPDGSVKVIQIRSTTGSVQLQ